MHTIRLLAFTSAMLGVSLLAAAPASAAGVLIVSAENGNDANNCTTFASACRTVAKALTVASSGDVIELVTGGNYFSATVTFEVTIFSRAGAFMTGGESPCVTINAGATDVVTIDGVNCLAESGGSNGIQFNTGEKLRVRNAMIRGGANVACGIFFQPDTNAELNIESTIVSENGTAGLGGGVCIVPRNGADVGGVIDRLTAQNNRHGLRTVGGVLSPITVLVQNSIFSRNVVGLRSTGAGSVVRVSDSSILGNTTGLFVANNGTFISLGGNVLRANGTNGSFPSSEAKE